MSGFSKFTNVVDAASLRSYWLSGIVTDTETSSILDIQESNTMARARRQILRRSIAATDTYKQDSSRQLYDRLITECAFTLSKLPRQLLFALTALFRMQIENGRSGFVRTGSPQHLTIEDAAKSLGQ